MARCNGVIPSESRTRVAPGSTSSLFTSTTEAPFASAMCSGPRPRHMEELYERHVSSSAGYNLSSVRHEDTDFPELAGLTEENRADRPDTALWLLLDCEDGCCGGRGNRIRAGISAPPSRLPPLMGSPLAGGVSTRLLPAMCSLSSSLVGSWLLATNKPPTEALKRSISNINSASSSSSLVRREFSGETDIVVIVVDVDDVDDVCFLDDDVDQQGEKKPEKCNPSEEFHK